MYETNKAKTLDHSLV